MKQQNKQFNNKKDSDVKTGFNSQEKEELLAMKKRLEEERNQEINISDDIDEILDHYCDEEPDSISQEEVTVKKISQDKKKAIASWIIAIGSGIALVASGILAGLAMGKSGRNE